MSGYLVGAYPASPAHKSWDPDKEAAFFNLLAQDERITALEIPWLGSIHPHDDNWLINNFPSHWNAVITSIPYVMGQISKSSNYGLASSDESGRLAAINDVQAIFHAIEKMNDANGRTVISGIEIHSAPRQTGEYSALAKSLEELSKWNRSGSKLVIEHCDAYIPNQTPEKGFLKLEDEILAIKSSGTEVGIVINWGRSAIELREAGRVVEHIDLAKSSGYLSGLIFSGASAVDGQFGYPWIDAHHPFRKSEQNPFGDPDSLLTEPLAKQAIASAATPHWLGIKMGWPPSVDGSLEERAAMISSALDALDRLQAE